MPIYDYRWAAGLNVALASLSNVEDDLFPYTRPRRVAPRSAPVDPYPVRTVLASGAERGDGRIDHAWEFTLPQAALDYIYTKFSLTSAVSANCTLYSRLHDRGIYARYNAKITKPKPGDTLEYLRGGILRATFVFRGLVAL